MDPIVYFSSVIISSAEILLFQNQPNSSKTTLSDEFVFYVFIWTWSRWKTEHPC